MESLRSILAAFLADLTCAQHRANQLSARLSREYRRGDILRFFPVPNALLEEAEVTLRFVLDSPAVDTELRDCTKPGSSAPALPSTVFVADLAADTALLLLTEVAARITGAGDERSRALVFELRQQLLSTRVRVAAVRNFSASLRVLLMLHTLHPDSAPLDSRAREALFQALLLTFGDDRDLLSVTGDLNEFLQKVLDSEAGRRAVALVLRASAEREEIANAVAQIPEMRVLSSAADLGGFPDHAVHSIRIRASLRNYKWIIVPEGDAQEDQLVPEA